MYYPHEFSPHSHSTSYYSAMKIIGPSTSISRHVPSACTLNMNSLPLLCLLRIPLPVPLPQDCGDACAASGECALLRGSKLLVFAEADQPMEQDREQDQGLSPHHMLFAKGLRWDWGKNKTWLSCTITLTCGAFHPVARRTMLMPCICRCRGIW